MDRLDRKRGPPWPLDVNCCQTAHIVITSLNEKHKLEHRKECGTQSVTGNMFRGCEDNMKTKLTKEEKDRFAARTRRSRLSPFAPIAANRLDIRVLMTYH